MLLWNLQHFPRHIKVPEKKNIVHLNSVQEASRLDTATAIGEHVKKEGIQVVDGVWLIQGRPQRVQCDLVRWQRPQQIHRIPLHLWRLAAVRQREKQVVEVSLQAKQKSV